LIDQTATMPDIPSIRLIKLPSNEQPVVYIVVQSEKISGIVLGIALFLALAACVIASAALVLLHQFIIAK